MKDPALNLFLLKGQSVEGYLPGKGESYSCTPTLCFLFHDQVHSKIRLYLLLARRADNFG